MSGKLTIAGLGPGDSELITPAVQTALAAATDIVGYSGYIKRVPKRSDLKFHSSDNRCEITRSQHALTLAKGGRQVVIVSSGDPGVFAMAAAVFEVIDADPSAWQSVTIEVLPGISAMLAAAARVGAPLGHDFCVINLSDNLKPWELIEKRLLLAVEADFAMALYNPHSAARSHGLDKTLSLLKSACGDTGGDDRLVIFARAVFTPHEQVTIIPLQRAEGAMADMQTIVLIGSSRTRLIRTNTKNYVYTPRGVPPV